LSASKRQSTLYKYTKNYLPHNHNEIKVQTNYKQSPNLKKLTSTPQFQNNPDIPKTNPNQTKPPPPPGGTNLHQQSKNTNIISQFTLSSTIFNKKQSFFELFLKIIRKHLGVNKITHKRPILIRDLS